MSRAEVRSPAPLPIDSGSAFTIGLSTVHANRTLMDLRGEGLITFDRGRLTILNWAGLTKAAQFDPAYLHLRKPATPA